MQPKLPSGQPGQPNPNPDPPAFDHLARPYRYLEYLTFGPYLHRTRTHYLPQLTHHKKALILGDGDGRFTAQLLQSNPHIHAHAVDISAKMLATLRRRSAPHASRLTTEQADLRTWQPNPHSNYDLIATHFLLDCLTTEEITQLAQRLNSAINPSLNGNAQWLISEFAIPKTNFGRLIASPLIALLYQSFRLLANLRVRQLPDHSKALHDANWTLQHHQPRLNGLLISQLWQRPVDNLQPRL